MFVLLRSVRKKTTSWQMLGLCKSREIKGMQQCAGPLAIKLTAEMFQILMPFATRNMIFWKMVWRSDLCGYLTFIKMLGCSGKNTFAPLQCFFVGSTGDDATTAARVVFAKVWGRAWCFGTRFGTSESRPRFFWGTPFNGCFWFP